jgi:hypothetical protein
VSLALTSGFFEQRQASALQGGRANRVLRDKPRGFRAVFAD